MNDQKRKTLANKLAALLGFEDGADDVLAHLLTIQTQDDLLDYLTQLLGTGNLEATRAFVRDVDRARRGQSISGDDGNEKVTAKPRATNKQPAMKAPAQKREPGPKNAPSSQPAKKDSQPASNNQTIKNSDTPAETRQSMSQSKIEDKSISKKSTPPPKGKAKYDCGCFGTLHRALTNCLYCGRIACEKEGYGFCPFCGYLVEEVKPPDGGEQSPTDEAWKHKERLLRYDREFAQRTIILDDQSDYFNRQTSMWSTDEEQAEAARLEQERHNDIHKRKTQMNLGI